MKRKKIIIFMMIALILYAVSAGILCKDTSPFGESVGGFEKKELRVIHLFVYRNGLTRKDFEDYLRQQKVKVLCQTASGHVISVNVSLKDARIDYMKPNY